MNKSSYLNQDHSISSQRLLYHDTSHDNHNLNETLSFIGGNNTQIQSGSRLKVQLFISCRDLVNVDYVGKTDSLVALYTKVD